MIGIYAYVTLLYTAIQAATELAARRLCYAIVKRRNAGTPLYIVAIAYSPVMTTFGPPAAGRLRLAGRWG